MEIKQLFTTILIFVAFTMLSNGQVPYPFPQPGLIQGELYHESWPDETEYNATIKYVGDTVFSLVKYSRFITRGNLYFYTRYDNGKVYLDFGNVSGGLSGTEILKYDFLLGINDTFPSVELGNLVVDSVSTITLLNGQQRKFMRLKNKYLKPYFWIDGIGDINNGFFYVSHFEGGYEHFICHKDSTGLVYLKTPVRWDCDSLTEYVSSPNEIISLEQDFSIFPNPSSHDINLKFYGFNKSEIFIQIINFLSQVVYTTKISKNSSLTSIELSHLKRGIYFIIASSNNTSLVKKLIKN